MTAPPAEPRLAAVVCDLDGTLVDSLDGIESSLRVALAGLVPASRLAALRDHLGPPLATMLVEMAPELDAAARRAAGDRFRADYDRRGYALTRPYPDVDAALRRLAAAGVRLFVLTNKRRAPTLNILRLLRWETIFEGVQTLDGGASPFAGKADAALALCSAAGLAGATSLLVGDSPEDADAARRCGLRFAHAAYGYGRCDAELRLERFSDLERLL